MGPTRKVPVTGPLQAVSPVPLRRRAVMMVVALMVTGEAEVAESAMLPPWARGSVRSAV